MISNGTPTLPKTNMVPLKIGRGLQKEIISTSWTLVFFFSEANAKHSAGYLGLHDWPRNKGMVPKYSLKTLDFFLVPHLFRESFQAALERWNPEIGMVTFSFQSNLGRKILRKTSWICNRQTLPISSKYPGSQTLPPCVNKNGGEPFG